MIKFIYRERVASLIILGEYLTNFDSINSNLSNIATTSAQQEKQLNSNLNEVELISDRLLTSFEQKSNNNTHQLTQLIAETAKLIKAIEKNKT